MVSVAPLLPWEPDIEEPDESLLVTEDDTPLDSILTEKQERLLSEPLFTSWSGPPPGPDGAARPFAVLANVGLFSSLHEQPVVPDVMLSLDVTVPADLEEKKNRSYFLWRYRKPPEVVIEIVSNKKGGELDARRSRYQRVQVAFYVVYDPLNLLGEVALRAFELHAGAYVELARPWFERVGLGLVEWEGTFEGIHRRWLRWQTRDGQVVPTGAERSQQEKARADEEKARADEEKARADEEKARADEQKARADEERARADEQKARADEQKARADEERARADEEKARAKRLAARLRAMGVDPDGEF